MERTFVMVKPDGVQRGLIGEIIGRFERRGLKIVGMKMMQVSDELARAHYAVHEGKPFFEGLVKYIVSAPVVAMVVEGSNAVIAVRQTVGATRPHEAAPGTIRADLAIEIGRNLVHASDAPETAAAEIALWFSEGVVEWQRAMDAWMIE
jgi:nucleoside-diphosphate kinase